MVVQEPVCGDEQRIRARADEAREGGGEVALAADLDDVQPQVQGIGSVAQVSDLRFGVGARVRVDEYTDGRGRGNQLMQHLKLSRSELSDVAGRTRDIAAGPASRPTSTGLPAVVKTTGIVEVAALAASAAAVTAVKMTATLRRTRSATIAGNRS
jgi:hypothetical protein